MPSNNDEMYKNNTGKLQISSIKTLKNLTIELKGSDYEIELPDEWIVKSSVSRNVYSGKEKTDTLHIVAELIPYNVAKVLYDAGMNSQIDNIESVNCQLPNDLTLDFPLNANSTIVKLVKPQVKPKWVSRGNSGSYAALRLEADNMKHVGELNE